MIHWPIISGIGARNTVTCRTRGGAPIPLSGSENFLAYYWTGETQTFAGGLDWAYNTLTAGTVDITVSAVVAASPPGLYQWVLELPDKSAAYARGSFEIVAGPGSGTATVSPYCAYQDLLERAPWVKFVSTPEGDTAGFLSKRILARNWLDWVVIRSWRGTSQAYFGDAGRTAQFWMGGWVRRTPLPSQWLADYVQGTNVGGANPNLVNALIVRPWVTRVCAYHTLGLIGLSQIGINNQYAAYGRYFKERAEEEVFCEAAEIDTLGTGKGQFAIPLQATNTLFT